MLAVKDYYDSYSEMCDDYNGGDIILSYPSHIISAIDKYVEQETGGEIDFTSNGFSKSFLPSFFHNCVYKIEINKLSEIGINVDIVDENEISQLFLDKDWHYLGIDGNTIYYVSYDD